ncbi:hypothetical protein XELAEV_18002914mg [Xenopus laevis]|uniref:AGC-kinase C-terminal domain-containing protein n=1 Tax=Xenopus laevis TaxID=8355 RepID=A0A974BNB5_XENLA|nr:hypothetical protein XELAEV_18002914mg [Xenopus laevis]
MKSIRYDEIELPEDLSEDVSNLIYQLLEKDPEYRLGSGEAGAEMIKEHPFFRVSFYSRNFDLQAEMHK